MDDIMSAFQVGPTSKNLADYLSVDQPSCRAAIYELFEAGLATYCRRGNAIHLLPVTWKAPICKVCRTEFERKGKSKRLTCSRTCHTKLGWIADPESREKRLASIRVARSSPEQAARTREINAERWAKPGAREKLSEFNRKIWADPESSIRRAAGIAKYHRSPDARKAQSDRMKERWADEAARELLMDTRHRGKCPAKTEAMKKRFEDPEYHAKVSVRLATYNEAKKKKHD